jgi:hypothetical protein
MSSIGLDQEINFVRYERANLYRPSFRLYERLFQKSDLLVYEVIYGIELSVI